MAPFTSLIKRLFSSSRKPQFVLETLSGDRICIDESLDARRCYYCFQASNGFFTEFRHYPICYNAIPVHEEHPSAFCALLRDCISIYDPHNSLGQLSIHQNVVGNNTWQIEIFALPGQPSIPFGIPQRVPPSGDTGSQKAVDWTKARLSGCTCNHDACGDGPATRLPDRVLDVGYFVHDEIRLLETFDKPVTGRYVTLSHRWGGKVPRCRTTKASLRSQTTSISFKSLPRTFRDAVTFVRGLGIRYLWIDSICIIQDDESDWEVQAAKMCDIYSQSYFTVAAAYSPDCHGGLFSETSDKYLPKKVGSIWEGDKECQLFARQIPPGQRHWNCGYQPPFPLFSRAWTYQERILSPRVLCFTPYELQWECQTAVSCECLSVDFIGPEIQTTPTALMRQLGINFGSLKTEHARMSAVRSTPETPVHHLWATVVVQYSRMDLTKDADKLPAIAGIAQQVSRSRPHAKYLAGLWSDSLSREIIWYGSTEARDGSAGFNSLPSQYRAPSWSWAAVDGPVSMVTDLNNFKLKAIIHSYSCAYVNDNPFGRAISGCLTVESKVYAWQLRYSYKGWYVDRNPHGFSERSCELYPDYDWGSKWFPKKTIMPLELAYFLEWAGDDRRKFYLVLQQRESGIFERIGLLIGYYTLDSGLWNAGEFENYPFYEIRTVTIT